VHVREGRKSCEKAPKRNERMACICYRKRGHLTTAPLPADRFTHSRRKATPRYSTNPGPERSNGRVRMLSEVLMLLTLLREELDAIEAYAKYEAHPRGSFLRDTHETDGGTF